MRMDFGEVRAGARCAVAFGYDVDMPGDFQYLYDRDVPWRPGGDGPYCHGHLNQDVLGYVKRLVSIAERYGVKLQFFLQGNTLEDPVEPWLEIVKADHAVDQHTYTHAHLLRTPLDKVESEIVRTKRLLEDKLGIVSIGLRGPGGYAGGLRGRDDAQRVILNAGIQFVSTHYYHYATDQRFTPEGDNFSIQKIADSQPFYYDRGLLEIPFCCYSDRQFFDVDQGGRGSKLSVDDWIAYLKRAVDFAHEGGLLCAFVLHPSTSFKHDPEARYLDELLSYCRQKPGTISCTFRDIYEWTREIESGAERVMSSMA